jgi:hypothetical protein
VPAFYESWHESVMIQVITLSLYFLDPFHNFPLGFGGSHGAGSPANLFAGCPDPPEVLLI